MSFTNSAIFFGFVALSYLLGSCLFGTWFWPRREGDPRELGGKNNGLVHLARGFGWARALFVSFLDIGKGVGIVLASSYFASWLGVWLGPISLAAVYLGHRYPLFRPSGFRRPEVKPAPETVFGEWLAFWRHFLAGRFAGGVGVSPLLGACLVLNPLVTLVTLMLWVGAVYLWKYSAVANLVTLASGLFLLTVTGTPLPWVLVVISCTTLVALAYLPSLKLLARGKETRLILFPGFSLATGLVVTEAFGPNGDFYVYDLAASQLEKTEGETVPWAFLIHPLSPVGFLDLDPTVAPALADREELRQEIETIAAEDPDLGQRLLARQRRHGDFFDAGIKKFGVRPIGEAVFEAAGKRTVGIFIFIPYLTERFQEAIALKIEGNSGLYEEIMSALVEAAQLAYRLGARMLGLGAFTSIISAGGADLLRRLEALGLDDLAVTSGNTFTSATLVEGAIAGCRKMGKDPAKASAIMYGLGSVGLPASFLLAKAFQRLTLVARNEGKLRRALEQLELAGIPVGHEVGFTTDLAQALPGTDVVVSAVSATGSTEVHYDHTRLDVGAVAVEGSRPFILPETAPADRPDCLFVEGAVLEGPLWVSCARFLAMGGEDRAFGCLMETILRAMDGSARQSAVGVKIDPAEISRLMATAKHYGVRLSGFRWQGRRMHWLAVWRIRLTAALTRFKKSWFLANSPQ